MGRKIERFLSQPFQVAEVFTNNPGKLVPIDQTISGFKEILDGKYDHLPEVAFYMVGNIEEVVSKAERLAAEAESKQQPLAFAAGHLKRSAKNMNLCWNDFKL